MAVSSFTNVSGGSCLHTDLNGKAIYRGASELLPLLQDVVLVLYISYEM